MTTYAHAQSLVDFTITTSGLRFSGQTAPQQMLSLAITGPPGLISGSASVRYRSRVWFCCDPIAGAVRRDCAEYCCQSATIRVWNADSLATFELC